MRALPFIADRPRERAAIVLITDGADTASDTTLHELRPALVRSDAFVYAIAIDTPEPQAIAKRVNVNTLNEITGQSGGRTEVVRATADLDVATSRIAEELNSQYVLAYASPTPGDGKYHSHPRADDGPDPQGAGAQWLRRGTAWEPRSLRRADG